MALGLPPVAGQVKAATGDISGTLTPEGVLTLLQALQAEQAQALGQRTQQASGAAQQAQGAYQGAAGAPPPGLLPGDTFIPSILGTLASVIGQSPEFSEQAQAGIQQTKASQLKARAENLQALRDVYLQRAGEAEKAGDLEATTKFRTQIETTSKALDVVNANAQRAFTAEENEKDRKAAMERARLTAAEKTTKGTPLSNIPIMAEMVVTGQAKLTDFPITDRDLIAAHLTRQGDKLLPPKARDTLATLNAAKGVLASIEKYSKKVNTLEAAGPLGITRVLVGTQKKIGAATQENADARLLRARGLGFLAALSRATGERGTLTDADIARAKELIPQLDDTREVAEGKIQAMREFLDEMAQRTIQTYTTRQPGQSQAPALGDPLGIR